MPASASAAPLQALSAAAAVAAAAAASSSSSQFSPEQLYQHVVGHWPGPELGYPADHSDAHGQSTQDDQAAPTADDADARGGARAKKRRKVQRRAKVSEIWFPRAEMAFCTCVASIPPNGRTKIKFFGRPLGRNELIAAICTLATRRLYNRKQISSHSQVLKDKVPPPFKEIFTFEDKSRGTDEPGESSTANVIEKYTFPDAIYNIIGYRPGTDLANAPKPAWLTDLESGVGDGHAASSSAQGDSSSRPYSYWNNSPSDYPSSYYDRGGASGYAPKGKDRDGRAPMASEGPTSPVDSYYQQYSPQATYRQPGGHLPPPYGSHMPPPHTLPPLPLPRDLDAAASLAEASSLNTGRFNFTQGGRSRGNANWEEHARSPTSTGSFDAQQSQSSGAAVSPRQATGAWNDSKPDLTLPPLQEVPSPTYNDWKDRALYPESKWSGGGAQSLPSGTLRGVQTMGGLPSLGSVASQTYAPNDGQWPSSPMYGLAPTWEGSNGRQRNDALSRLGSFAPSTLEVTAHMENTVVPLTPSDPLVTAEPIPWHQIYMWNARYPFLESVAQNPGVPVYHVDVPISLPADHVQRAALLERVVEFGVHISLRSLVGDTTGWVMTSDSGFISGMGTMRYPRVVTALRGYPSGEMSSTVRLGELARLYEHFVRNADESRGLGDALASVALPMSSLVQRVMRDTSPDLRTPPETLALTQMGSDWSSAAAVVIYSFWVADGQGQSITCRAVDFDSPAGGEGNAADQLVGDLLAAEEQQPSKFEWL